MRLFTAVLGVCIFLHLTLVTGPAVADTKDKSESVKVTAMQLLEDYKGIEKEPDPKKRYKEADDKYKGKVLELTGVLSDAGGPNTPYFFISAGTGFRVRLWCSFGNEHRENLKALRKAKLLTAGAKVTIRGTCSGMKGRNLHIDDCIMVDPPFPK